MNGELNKIVKNTLKKYGDGAAEHFGVNPTTLKGYVKKGKYPLAFVEKILADASGGAMSATMEEQPMPSMNGPVAPVAEPALPKQAMTIDQRVSEIERYLKETVDYYLRQFNTQITNLATTVNQLQVEHLRHLGMPSLSRPDQHAPVEQVFTTNPNAGFPNPGAGLHPMDSGLAPTKAQVDAQAGMMTMGGAPLPQAQVAGPAVAAPQPAFGFGWNQPRVRK